MCLFRGFNLFHYLLWPIFVVGSFRCYTIIELIQNVRIGIANETNSTNNNLYLALWRYCGQSAKDILSYRTYREFACVSALTRRSTEAAVTPALYNIDDSRYTFISTVRIVLWMQLGFLWKLVKNIRFFDLAHLH